MGQNLKIRDFLCTVKAQIGFSEAHAEIERELSRHLEEIIEELMSEGITRDEAVNLAVQRMGDPKKIGQDLNRIHMPEMPWLFLILVLGMIMLCFVNLIY